MSYLPSLDPSFMYIASYLVAHMKLPRWAEPLAGELGHT